MHVNAQPGFGQNVQTNDGWLFTLADLDNGADPGIDDRDWQRVDLPHDWSVKGKLDSTLASRSEEHTSELQSLMRISYAVFCLKKKKKTKQRQQPSKDQQKAHRAEEKKHTLVADHNRE